MAKLCTQHETFRYQLVDAYGSVVTFMSEKLLGLLSVTPWSLCDANVAWYMLVRESYPF